MVHILAENEKMKFSHIRQEVNKRTGRGLTIGAFIYQINKLRKRGLGVRRERGIYKLKQ